MGMMLIAGRLGFVQPKYLITAGAIIAGCAMIDLVRMTPDADFWFFAWSRIYLSVGLPLIFIPITTATYDGLPPEKTDQASALIKSRKELRRLDGGIVEPDGAGPARTVSSGPPRRGHRIAESVLLRHAESD